MPWRTFDARSEGEISVCSIWARAAQESCNIISYCVKKEAGVQPTCNRYN